MRSVTMRSPTFACTPSNRLPLALVLGHGPVHRVDWQFSRRLYIENFNRLACAVADNI
jgi:hypothetical protein